MRATKFRATFVSIIALFTSAATAQDTRELNRVAVIDTGLDIKSEYYKPFLCPSGHKDFTGTGIQDDDGHGTYVANLIVTNSHTDNFCLVIYKFYTNKIKRSWNRALMEALQDASKQKIKLVNLSLSGAGYMEDEDDFFSNNRDITFITAAGNDGVDIKEDPRYPASYDYPNIWVVGALDRHSGERHEVSNYGYRVRFWEKADATSYATAIKTGKVIKQKFGGANGVF
jgi:subtilisin family serine protease